MEKFVNYLAKKDNNINFDHRLTWITSKIAQSNWWNNLSPEQKNHLVVRIEDAVDSVIKQVTASY